MGHFYIDYDEIKRGSSSKGIIHLNFNENIKSYGSFTVDVRNLPIKDFSMIPKQLPKEVSYYSYPNNDVVRINEFTFSYDPQFSKLVFTIKGEKLKSYSNYFSLRYKIYDTDGYLVKSGSIYLDNLSLGDMFKKEETVYDLTDASYTIDFYDYS